MKVFGYLTPLPGLNFERRRRRAKEPALSTP